MKETEAFACGVGDVRDVAKRLSVKDVRPPDRVNMGTVGEAAELPLDDKDSNTLDVVELVPSEDVRNLLREFDVPVDVDVEGADDNEEDDERAEGVGLPAPGTPVAMAAPLDVMVVGRLGVDAPRLTDEGVDIGAEPMIDCVVFCEILVEGLLSEVAELRMDCTADREAAAAEEADVGKELLLDGAVARERLAGELAEAPAEPLGDTGALSETLATKPLVGVAESLVNCVAVRAVPPDEKAALLAGGVAVLEELASELGGAKVAVTTDVPGVTRESELGRLVFEGEPETEPDVLLPLVRCNGPPLEDGDTPRAVEGELIGVLCKVLWPCQTVDVSGGGEGRLDALLPVTVAAMDENVDLVHVADTKVGAPCWLVWLAEKLGCGGVGLLAALDDLIPVVFVPLEEDKARLDVPGALVAVAATSLDVDVPRAVEDLLPDENDALRDIDALPEDDEKDGPLPDAAEVEERLVESVP